MLKKAIISLLVLEAFLIAAIFVSVAYDSEDEPMVRIAEVVTFTDSNGENTEVDIVDFITNNVEAYVDNTSFEIHYKLLSVVDADKVVDLIDRGLLLYVVGDDLSTQAIGDILGIEEVSNTSVSGAELYSVMIYRSGHTYGCETYGNVAAERVRGVRCGETNVDDKINTERLEITNQFVQEPEIFCFSENLNVSYSTETFNDAGVDDLERCEHIRIDMEILSEIDSDKLVELMDSGIIISVRGKNITPQEVITTLGMEDICHFDSEDKKADSVKIYKDDNGYVCEKGGIDKVYREDGTIEIVETD